MWDHKITIDFENKVVGSDTMPPDSLSMWNLYHCLLKDCFDSADQLEHLGPLYKVITTTGNIEAVLHDGWSFSTVLKTAITDAPKTIADDIIVDADKGLLAWAGQTDVKVTVHNFYVALQELYGTGVSKSYSMPMLMERGEATLDSVGLEVYTLAPHWKVSDILSNVLGGAFMYGNTIYKAASKSQYIGG